MDRLTYGYAIVGGPPDDWHLMRVYDRASGRLIDDVVEASADEGWVITIDRDDDGHVVLKGSGDRRRPSTTRSDRSIIIRKGIESDARS